MKRKLWSKTGLPAQICATFFLLIPLFGIGQSYEWTHALGNTGYDYAYDVATDPNGNVLISGYFQDSFDADPGPDSLILTSGGSYDAFLLKYSPTGNLLWAKQLTNSGNASGYAVETDDFGNVFWGGRFYLSAIVDSTTINAVGATDGFVIKLTSSGQLSWAKAFGGNGNDYVRDLTTDPFGNVYTAGYFQGAANFDPDSTFTLTSYGNDDAFIQKLDAAGDFQWAGHMGGTGADRCYGIAYANGHIYTTGIFMYSGDFNPNPGVAALTSNGGTDIFVHKADTLGNFMWARHMGSNGNDYGNAIAADDFGNVYTTGYFINTAYFTPDSSQTLMALGGTDVFVQKLSASGQVSWVRQLGGTSSEVGNDVYVDIAGDVITSGFFYQSVDFDPGVGTFSLTAGGLADAFIQKMDSAGALAWAHKFGGSGYDEGRAAAVSAQGGIFSVGHFQQSVDFDPFAGSDVKVSAGNNDVFIQKMFECQPISSVMEVEHCGPYTWLNGNLYSTSTVDSVLMMSSKGCDSTVFLDLTVNGVTNLNVVQSDTQLIAQNTLATYQWLDCDSNFAPIPGATSAAFSPGFNGHFAVELTENGCVDTSACFGIQTISIPESGMGFIEVYPTALRNKVLHINYGLLFQGATFHLNDFSGRTVFASRLVDPSPMEFNVDLPAGLYTLLIEAPTMRQTFKVEIL